ncbi:MAG: hypothetical protein HBSAPP01_27170 [Candidatus Brocadia sapporoensis]|nr:MAG: hypothetical protein HBSAPP01_27170 [Candidatus Brocadia sapporoensis]
MEKAGINDVAPHTLRRTLVTRLVQKGEDICKIVKLPGHRDIRMAFRQACHYPDNLRDGV